VEWKEGNAMLFDEVSDMLAGKIISFWKSLHDSENGGYFGQVDFNLTIRRSAEKSSILNSRILWFFSTAAVLLKRSDLAQEADHAYAFLKDAFLDREFGGLYRAVLPGGKVLDDSKDTCSLASAVYALSAYYQLTSDPEALSLAGGIYRLMETQCAAGSGYLNAFDRCFHPIRDGKGIRDGCPAEDSLNTLLHVFEAYCGLYRAAPDPRVAQSIKKILLMFLDKVYDPAAKKPETPDSCGFDIEASWLLDQGCGLLEEKGLSRKVSSLTSRLAARVYRKAYRGHSVRSGYGGEPENEMRVGWVQAEAVVGFLSAYQKKPGHPEYLRAAADVWNYIKTYLADPRPGSEWFWQVDGGGHPDSSRPIAGPWKSPCHNGRMCFEILRWETGVRANKCTDKERLSTQKMN
jgi:mannobiose 2-epimerase